MLVSFSEIATELARGLVLRKNPTILPPYEEIVVSSPSTSSSVAWRKSCLLDSKLSGLSHLPPPVLTAYLDVNPANPRNQPTPRGYVTWLKSAGQAFGKELPRDGRNAFRIQLKRIEDYLSTHRPRGRGLLVLAGLNVWEMLPLQVNVTEELHWGKPSLQQIIWVLDEHRPRGAILVDGSGGRFFRFWLGTVTEDEAAAFFKPLSCDARFTVPTPLPLRLGR